MACEAPDSFTAALFGGGREKSSRAPYLLSKTSQPSKLLPALLVKPLTKTFPFWTICLSWLSVSSFPKCCRQILTPQAFSSEQNAPARLTRMALSELECEMADKDLRITRLATIKRAIAFLGATQGGKATIDEVLSLSEKMAGYVTAGLRKQRKMRQSKGGRTGQRWGCRRKEETGQGVGVEADGGSGGFSGAPICFGKGRGRASKKYQLTKNYVLVFFI